MKIVVVVVVTRLFSKLIKMLEGSLITSRIKNIISLSRPTQKIIEVAKWDLIVDQSILKEGRELRVLVILRSHSLPLLFDYIIIK